MVKIKGVDKTEATFDSVLLMDFLADGRLDRQKGMERGLLLFGSLSAALPLAGERGG